MEWHTFKKFFKIEIEKDIYTAFFDNKYNINLLLNKNLFNNICINAGEFICNVENKEFLGIDFTLCKKPDTRYHYSVPLTFIEVEDNIFAEDENGHEICKLAATNAPLKIFITKYIGNWREDRRAKEYEKFDSSLIERFEFMVDCYAKTQKKLFNPEMKLIICQIYNNIISFYTEFWDQEKSCFMLESETLFERKINN